MALRTRRDLVTAVLSQLRVIGADETPDAADFADVTAHYADLHDELKDNGLCYWPNTADDTAEIPGAIFRALANVLAEDASDSFGKEPPKLQDNDGQVITGRPFGLRQIRKHMAKKPSGEPTPFSIF